MGDFGQNGCSEALSASYTPSSDTRIVGAVPEVGTIFLVRTGLRTQVKLVLTLVDFTRPNGLGFDYEVLDCGDADDDDNDDDDDDEDDDDDDEDADDDDEDADDDMV